MTPRKLEFGVPEWARMVILAISISVALIGVYAALNFTTWNPGKAEWAVYCLWIIAGAQVLFLLRFRNIPWVDFVADARGIKVRAPHEPDERNRWINVDWGHIGQIDLIWFRKRPRIAVELFISDADIERYFSGMVKTRRILRQPVRNGNGAFAIKFRCTFHTPEKVVAQLEAFRGAGY